MERLLLLLLSVLIVAPIFIGVVTVLSLGGLAVVVVALAAIVAAVVECCLAFEEGLEGPNRFGMVVEGQRIEHVKGVVLEVGSCGLANI